MPRRIAIISAVALTAMMGAWLFSIGARSFNVGDTQPASAITLEVTATPQPAVAVAPTAAVESQPQIDVYDDDLFEDDDAYEHEHEGDDGGEDHEGYEVEHEDED